MSLQSSIHPKVGLSTIFGLILSVLFLFIREVESQAGIPEVLHHGSCNKEYLHGPRRILTSPGYPQAYRNYTSCQWYIVAEPDEIITLSFDDLDIEEGSDPCQRPPCCTLSWVKLGPDQEERFCGQSGPETLLPTAIAKNGALWIKFHTARKTTAGRGFKLTFVVGKKHMKTCAPDEFQCTDQSNCILAAWRCNKRFECLDGSDEENCPKHCSRTQLRCVSGHQCYELSQRCDGYMDCSDFSDELDCGRCESNHTACGASPHVCYNPYISRCNRVLDCPNGEDEQGCSSSCQQRKIPCSSGIGCYSMDERCNGVAQCSDASDEKNCRADLCRSERGGFLCHNRHCIRETWRCDRTNDCGDESDEISCLRNSVIAAAIIGSLICGLLLIIAISCSCKLYALRHSELQSGVSREGSRGGPPGGETPLSRLEREFMYREPPPAYAVAIGAPQWGECPPSRMEGRPRRNSARRGLRREQHRRISQSIRPANCNSPTTGDSSVASTSSAASSPSVLSLSGESPGGATSPSGAGEMQTQQQPSTSQSRKKVSAPRWQLPETLQQREELKPEVSGESNSVEMTTTSDVAPLLP